MKKLFTAVRKDDLETLKTVLEKKPELLHCVATPPPKKDAATSRHRTGFLPPTAAAISSKTQSMTVLRNTRIST